MNPFVQTILSQVLSWRTLAIILALLNLKSLPFAWHLRLFALMLRHGRSLKRNRSFLERASSPSLTATQKRIHPIFRPVSIPCRTSLYEIDYNLHKSNSTYFADLDHSRTALVASLVGPALARSTLKAHGEKPGVLYPILGSVHTSFLREIKPLQAYTVRSRLLGWDRKWLVILSCFVRPATRAEQAKAKKQGISNIGLVNNDEVLLACALNKYVIKHGRKTIEPGLALAGSGWFRARSGITHAIAAAPDATTSGNSASGNNSTSLPESSSAAATGNNTPLPAPSKASIEAAETVSKVVRRLSSAAADETSIDLSTESTQSSSSSSPLTNTEEKEVGGWTWAEINDERLRGLKVAESWLGLDAELRDEYIANSDIL